ncbi:uncharacterized protein LOC126895477 isoform X2 [Daktulosphaira vitifoliae]|uniref:uncharacterized protein LOC126895477 isoform X2 n=1 Tax=Daktulosphaira vitifoliae TaxID=58002 RepID=UPI0021A9A7E5|nr:uncharacterized protein LOC126895477 isoform X2 [Daktulosphaira vitifoliae]XP_050523350.1 uncharacterized protein LOC126895477 isoform X2 [Daktulosphaira vitifoliae]XP_050523351.1 uncharacterized protein LOC126895477 isoform X2 [Daktulosphaira vitifoliae]
MVSNYEKQQVNPFPLEVKSLQTGIQKQESNHSSNKSLFKNQNSPSSSASSNTASPSPKTYPHKKYENLKDVKSSSSDEEKLKNYSRHRRDKSKDRHSKKKFRRSRSRSSGKKRSRRSRSHSRSKKRSYRSRSRSKNSRTSSRRSRSPYSRHNSKYYKKRSPSNTKEKYSSHNYFIEKKANSKRQILDKLGIELKVPPTGDLSCSTSHVTPQLLLQQTMEAQVEKVKTQTGIQLPSYYNPIAVNPNKYAEQIQKRKLLWGHKQNSNQESETQVVENQPTATNSNNTAKIWQSTKFGDQDGKVTAKFKRLMGIKDDGQSTDNQANQQGQSKDIIKKQEEMFHSMESQYEVARMATHTHRGLGLGFGTFQQRIIMATLDPLVVYKTAELEDDLVADVTTVIESQTDSSSTNLPLGRLLSLEFFSTEKPELIKLLKTVTTSTVSSTENVSSVSTEVSDYAVKNLLVPICHPSNGIPSVEEYFTAINLIGVTIFTLGAIFVFVILYLYIDTLKYIMKNSPPMVKTHSAFILSVYPVVAIATYCAILVPRAHLLAEALTQGMFMASMYQLFCLFMAYCGGEANLIASVKPQSLDMQVPPCCCWPCCCCLPKFTLTKKHLRHLRMLVLQLPVVQGFVYMILLVMWAEEESLYQVNYMYLQPFIVMSIFCGMWGISMTLRVLGEMLKDHNVQGKFIVLQLVLVLAKLQGLAFRSMVWAGWLPCKPPITPTVYANLIYNSTMLWEMMLLAWLARKLYKKPLPTDHCFVEPPKITCCVDIPTNQEKNNIINYGRYNQSFDLFV